MDAPRALFFREGKPISVWGGSAQTVCARRHICFASEENLRRIAFSGLDDALTLGGSQESYRILFILPALVVAEGDHGVTLAARRAGAHAARRDSRQKRTGTRV